jgi:HK97 family phage portal protein
MKLFTRKTSGSTVPPDPQPLSMVFQSTQTTKVGPGGGYGWGGGPRTFVGSSRGLAPIVEVGREGDFPEGSHVWGPAEGDLGFPHATRWPGWPGSWEPPFFARSTGYAGDYPGRFLGGALLEGRVSTVFACTDLISRSLATMGLRVMKDNAPQEPPAWVDNPEPVIYTSIVDAMQSLVNSMLHRGEAFVIPTARYADGMVARWVVLNPDYVDVEASAGGLPVYSIGGMDIARTEILHIRYQVWPGNVHGVGPLEACWRNLVAANAMEKYGTELAVSNGIPTAVLQSDAKLSKVQAGEVKQSWAEATMSRGALPAVLSGGLTYTPLNLNPAEVGLLDLRAFDEQRIASTFGVPLWLVGLPVNDGLTYSTVEDTFDFFWRATLRPLAYNIACALSGWALARGSYLRFASEQLIEPSIAERAGIYETLIRSGVITVEEARIMEHLPPVPQEGTDLVASIRNEGV